MKQDEESREGWLDREKMQIEWRWQATNLSGGAQKQRGGMAKRKSAELGERRVLVKGMAHSQSRIVERGKDGNEKTQGHDGTSGGMGL